MREDLRGMGSFLDNTCAGMTRRDLIKVGSLPFFGLGLTEFLALKADADATQTLKSKGAKKDMSVILLWMAGGPSHIDTFDPKPKAGVEIHGPFEAIKTAAPGMYFSEHLPKLAKVADKMSVLRVTHGDGAHERAQHYMQTGYLPIPTMEFPSYGAIVAKEKGMSNNLPPYVTLLGRDGEGYGPGYLGASHNPFFAGDPSQGNYSVPDLPLPSGVNRSRLDRRRALLATLDTLSRNNDSVKSMDTFFDNAYKLVTSKDSQKAFDIAKEPEKLRDTYGRNSFGQACLMARRLVASGVRFVTITQGGWDTHENNFPSLQNNLLPTIDAGYSSLITDLAEHGMLDSTLVVWMGEFGRTPTINMNRNPGRDHWPNALSVVMAGGGTRGGQVIGETDERGMGPKERAIKVEDVAASIFHAIGVDPEKEYMTPTGRPVRAANEGKVIRELF